MTYKQKHWVKVIFIFVLFCCGVISVFKSLNQNTFKLEQMEHRPYNKVGDVLNTEDLIPTVTEPEQKDDLTKALERCNISPDQFVQMFYDLDTKSPIYKKLGDYIPVRDKMSFGSGYRLDSLTEGGK